MCSLRFLKYSVEKKSHLVRNGVICNSTRNVFIFLFHNVLQGNFKSLFSVYHHVDINTCLVEAIAIRHIFILLDCTLRYKPYEAVGSRTVRKQIRIEVELRSCMMGDYLVRFREGSNIKPFNMFLGLYGLWNHFHSLLQGIHFKFDTIEIALIEPYMTSSKSHVL